MNDLVPIIGTLLYPQIQGTNVSGICLKSRHGVWPSTDSQRVRRFSEKTLRSKTDSDTWLKNGRRRPYDYGNIHQVDFSTE